MYLSVFEVAKSYRFDPHTFTEFAVENKMKYGVELHVWGEIVVDVLELGPLIDDFSTRFPDHCNLPPSGEDDPECEWHPLDVFRVDRQGNRVWSEDNPKWKPDPLVVKRRLPG